MALRRFECINANVGSDRVWQPVHYESQQPARLDRAERGVDHKLTIGAIVAVQRSAKAAQHRPALQLAPLR
jgi:hypothetical protein